MNAIMSSAMKAIAMPCGPGNVATYFTAGLDNIVRATKVTTNTPAIPPMNCAMTYKNASQFFTLPRRQNVRVTAGLKWAPERLPRGEKTNAMAVPPIAIPVSMRRTNGSGIRLRTGDDGCQSNIVKSEADTMNKPSSAASQKYSGQCSFSERNMSI